MLFILAIDPQQKILELATHKGLLSLLLLTSAKQRRFLYAIDAAIFINPTQPDLEVVKGILQAFGNITSLVTNFRKSSIHLIKYENINL